jgi:hypothetical protein
MAALMPRDMLGDAATLGDGTDSGEARVPHVAGGKGTLKGKEAGIRDVHTERENRILLNTHTDNEKGNGQRHRVPSVSFFSCNRLIPAA